MVCHPGSSREHGHAAMDAATIFSRSPGNAIGSDAVNESPTWIKISILGLLWMITAVGVGCSEGGSGGNPPPDNYSYTVRQSAYLAQAAAEPGVQRLPSGLIMRELSPGVGESPTLEDKVEVHYRGTLIHGSVFDSTRKLPATFAMNGVIECWTEALTRMRVGGKALLTCPPELAYGSAGHPPRIRGGAVLNFEIELVKIVR